jgi:membrane-anchored glycerophosphoryl diester phosphodiesterase (GDPDase)
MASKKTSKTEESGFGALGALFSTLLMAPLISKVESFVMESLKEAKKNTEQYFAKLLKVLVLVGIAFAGVMFILVGLARIINETLRKTGSGELIIGGTIILIALIWYLMPGKKK